MTNNDIGLCVMLVIVAVFGYPLIHRLLWLDYYHSHPKLRHLLYKKPRNFPKEPKTGKIPKQQERPYDD